MRRNEKYHYDSRAGFLFARAIVLGVIIGVFGFISYAGIVRYVIYPLEDNVTIFVPYVTTETTEPTVDEPTQEEPIKAADSVEKKPAPVVPPPQIPPPKNKEPEPPLNEFDPASNKKQIDLRSVVAIRCTFTNASGTESFGRATGFVVGADGYVLTNRHVVDPEWTARAYGEEARKGESLKSCHGVLLDSERKLDPNPQPTYPSSPYPFYDVQFHPSNWDFRLEVHFVHTQESFTDTENAALDFALLKIAEWNAEKYANPSRARPALVPAPVLGKRNYGTLIPENAPVLIPGYAFQPIGQDAFDVFRLLTLTYTITGIYYGDAMFSDTPITYTSRIDGPDVAGGRSGSPLFWNGYVVGIYQATSKSSAQESIQLNIYPVVTLLEDNGLVSVIDKMF